MKTLRTSLTLLNPPKSSGWAAPHRGSRHARGYGAMWDAIRTRVLERDSGICQTCLRAGFPKPGNIVDHIRPKAEGGTDSLVNLEVICHSHHKAKTQAEASRARSV